MTMHWVRQQDFDTTSLRLHGCALAASINGMVDASGGEWRPSDDDGTDLARILKARSGVSEAEFNARGVTSRELFKALSSTSTDNDEWMPLRIRAFHGWLVSDMLDEMAKQGGSLLVAVRNRVLAKAGKTRFPDFMGGHWGAVTGFSGTEDVRWIAGERSPIALPIRVLTDAADQFGDKRDVGLADDSWGDGRGEAILVYRWQPWRAGYADMKRQRDAARSQLAECEANGPGADALAAARAGGIRDAAAAAGAVR